MISALTLGLLPAVASEDGKVYVIRHGEKTWTLGCLNDEGQDRAQNLMEVFSGHASSASHVFPEPKAIFANKYGDVINCERCLETVTPLAESLQLTVNHSFGYNSWWVRGNERAAAAVKEALRTTGGPVLVAWEHINIQHITRHLGAPRETIPVWDHGDYDTIYELTYNSTFHFQSLMVSAQNFGTPGHRRLSSGEVQV